MAISLVSLADTFLYWMLRSNEVISAVNGLSTGSTNVANSSIIGTIMRLTSNNAGIAITNGSPNVGETIYISTGTLSTIDDTSTSNIASAAVANTINETARAAFGQANTANSVVTAALNDAANNTLSSTAAFNKANSANVLAYQSGITGGAAFDKANSANIFAFNTDITAQSAFNQANSAYNQANTANTEAAVVASNTTYGKVLLANTKQYREATSGARALTPDQVWLSANTVSLSNVAGGGTIDLDFSRGFNFNINITASCVLGNPSNVKPGQSGYISILSNTANLVLSYDTNWKFKDSTTPTNSSNTTAPDILFYIVLPSGNTYGSLATSVPR